MYILKMLMFFYMNNKKDESLDIAKLGTQKFAKNITFDRVALWSAVDVQKFDEAITYANKIITTDSVEKSARDYIYYGLALKGNKSLNIAMRCWQSPGSIWFGFSTNCMGAPLSGLLCTI